MAEWRFGFAQRPKNTVGRGVALRLRSAPEEHSRSVSVVEPTGRKGYDMKGYTYILKCADGSYYTGSTKNLERRLSQHINGEGANFTKKHLPVELVYFEEFERIDEAFYREKQIQGWTRKKKEALINGEFNKLHELAKCQNETIASALRLRSAPEEHGTVGERSRTDRPGG